MPNNLVTNPGFETGNFSGWAVGGTQSTSTSDNIGVDTYSADVHSGNYGAFAGNATQTSLSQIIPTIVGVTYTVSYYLDVYQADATDGFMTASFGQTEFENLQEPSETDSFTKYTATVSATSTATPLTFTFDDPGGYFGFDDVSVVNPAACFCRGTLILTDRGQVAVEVLAIGDRVITLGGSPQPVRWIGRRSYRGRSLAGRSHLYPVVIREGALGDGLPCRDLRVSPLHAMFLDGVLVPAWALVNGSTIAAERTCSRVDYFHVELAQHDVIFAEGSPTESFVDDDSRWLFDNAREYATLYPAGTPPAEYCAPRHVSGPEIEAIRQKLAYRAGERTLARL